jgi:hypothetical protein
VAFGFLLEISKVGHDRISTPKTRRGKRLPVRW